MNQQYVIVLGSNLGEREATFEKACRLIAETIGSIEKQTEQVNTAPALVLAQPQFLNQGLLVSSHLEPRAVLEQTQAIEKELGRIHRMRYGPREIDIDIVWYSGGCYAESPELILPHPHNRARYWVRNFLAELLPHEKDGSGVYFKDMQASELRSVQDFRKKKENGEKVTVLTAYDYTMAKLLSRTSLDCVLVGDSLGNVIQGQDNTLPVTLEDMIYHTRAVRRAMPDQFIIADLPFLSYQTSAAQALESGGRLVKEGWASAVKLEGPYPEAVQELTKAGVPTMAHLGLTPQSLLSFGGYRLQAKSGEAQEKMLREARELEKAGAFSIVLEMVPREAAALLTRELAISTIGIGAGNETDGQVLVVNDMLGLDPDFAPRFVRRFETLADKIIAATEAYCSEVRKQSFPTKDESYGTKKS